MIKGIRDFWGKLPGLVLACVSIAVLVFLRDVYLVGINKYILLAVAAGFIVVAQHEYALAFFCFLLPLFSGLPGRYIILLYIIRLLIHRPKTSKLPFSLFGLVVCIILELTHAIVDVPLMSIFFWCSNLLLLWLMMTDELTAEGAQRNVLSFSVGNTVSMVTIILSTARMGFLERILNGEYRLGEFEEIAGESYVKEMHLEGDPNYLGLFCLTAIIALFAYLQHSPKNKLVSLVLMIANGALGFVTFSRTYLLLCVLTVLLLLLYRNRTTNVLKIAGRVLLFVVLVAVVLLVVYTVFPGTMENLLQRMEEKNMATGGGRTELLSAYLSAWGNDLFAFVFGTGFQSMLARLALPSDLHCMQLEILVGGGILGLCAWTVLLVAFRQDVKKIMLQRQPFGYLAGSLAAIQFIYYAMLPVMKNTVQLFPIILCVYVAVMSKEVVTHENAHPGRDTKESVRYLDVPGQLLRKKRYRILYDRRDTAGSDASQGLYPLG